MYYFFGIGEWMNESAGMAFAPHVIRIRSGEVCCIFLSIEQLLYLCLNLLQMVDYGSSWYICNAMTRKL